MNLIANKTRIGMGQEREVVFWRENKNIFFLIFGGKKNKQPFSSSIFGFGWDGSP
jgi:hypothetical protein